MHSFGVADVLVLLMFVLLMLDSRRLHALANGRGRRDQADGIPVGVNPDQVGLTLRDIQLRRHVDWGDGGFGWEGLPEILPVEEPEDLFAEEPEELFADDLLEDESDDELAEAAATLAAAEPNRALPVLWKPFPALLPAAVRDCQPVSTTSSPTVTRPPATTAA